MAFVRLAFFPGGTERHYSAIGAELAGVEFPPGRLMFAAGPADGGWQVVQVWETRAQLDAFNQAHFLPALARAAGRAFPQPPRVTDFETLDLSFSAP